LSSAQNPGWLIDISRLLWRSWQGRLLTGIDRVTFEYVKHFGPRSSAIIQVRGHARVLSYARSQRVFSILQGASNDSVISDSWARNALLREIAPGLIWPSRTNEIRGRLGIYPGHTGLESPDLIRWIIESGQRPVYFLHDLIPCSHPEYCRPGVAAIHAQRVRHMLATAHAIIVNSKFTQDALSEFARAEKLRQPPVKIAWLGSGIGVNQSIDQPAPRFDQPYFVMLGTIEPRKNHLRILEIWRDWTQHTSTPRPHLLIIGQRGWECENVINMLDRCTSIRPWVHELGRCSDAELNDYLRHARALLLPSFVEGFGMPVIEALANGLPVIASDLSVFREIAGNTPDYLDPADGIGWRTVIANYCAPDSPQRAKQIERMANLEIPTWDQHFSRVENFLKDGIMSRSFGS